MKSCQWAMAILVNGIISTPSICVLAQTTEEKTSSSTGQNPDMMEIIDEAIASFQAGQYKTSIDKFQQAYDMVEDANILFNIARCYHLLGDKEKAIEFYNRFISDSNVPEDTKTRARKYLQQLNENEEESTKTYSTAEPQKPSPTAEPAAEPSNQADSPQPTATDDSPSRSKILGWTLFGTGAAVAVAGGVLGGVALGNYKDFESSHDYEQKKDIEDKGKTLALVSDICLGVGIVSAATGVILLVIRGRHKKHSSTTTAYTPVVTPDGMNISWTLHF